MKHRKMICVATGTVLALLNAGCVVERTVTDSSGQVIYQEPEVHTPWESDEKKRQEVMEKERALGW